MSPLVVGLAILEQTEAALAARRVRLDAAGNPRIRRTEIRMVECVEEFSPQLERQVFPEFECFGNIYIQIADGICPAGRDVSRRGAGHFVTRTGERSRIQVLALSVQNIVCTKPGAWIADQIGALRPSSDGKAVGGSTNRERLTGLIGHEAADLPSANHRIRELIHVIAKRSPSAKGEFVGGGNHKPVWRIVGGNTPFRRQIVFVLHRTKAPESAAQTGIGSRVRIRKLMRASIVAGKA